MKKVILLTLTIISLSLQVNVSAAEPEEQIDESELLFNPNQLAKRTTQEILDYTLNWRPFHSGRELKILLSVRPETAKYLHDEKYISKVLDRHFSDYNFRSRTYAEATIDWIKDFRNKAGYKWLANLAYQYPELRRTIKQMLLNDIIERWTYNITIHNVSTPPIQLHFDNNLYFLQAMLALGVINSADDLLLRNDNNQQITAYQRAEQNDDAELMSVLAEYGADPERQVTPEYVQQVAEEYKY